MCRVDSFEKYFFPRTVQSVRTGHQTIFPRVLVGRQCPLDCNAERKGGIKACKWEREEKVKMKVKKKNLSIFKEMKGLWVLLGLLAGFSRASAAGIDCKVLDNWRLLHGGGHVRCIVEIG